ncbi:MAG: hypothetical protein ACI9D5_002070 [Candidatus Endobugula sp.]|jgi:hypothetical protein
MPRDKNLLNKRKQALLTELESIKGLLNTVDPDSIPLLEDAILEGEHAGLIEDEAIVALPIEPSVKLFEEQYDELPIENLAPTLSDKLHPPATISNGTLPGQQSLFKASSDNNTNRVPAKAGSKASLAQNPFLPPHVRERFERAIEDDNPSNNSATDFSTATTKPTVRPIQTPTGIPTGTAIDNDYAERLVDQLVAHHLPQIETELRKRLSTIAQQHMDNIKK